VPQLCVGNLSGHQRDRNLIFYYLLISSEPGDEGESGSTLVLGAERTLSFPKCEGGEGFVEYERGQIYQEEVWEPSLFSLSAWMVMGVEFEGGRLVSGKDLRQRFALSPYIRMAEVEQIPEDQLVARVYEDAVKYVEENVLRVKLGQLGLDIQGDDLYSPRFGGKSLLEMCRDAVVVREEKGIDGERVRHEGLGISNLVRLLKVMHEGEVAVIVSPPDEDDENMPGYSMVYLYEKRANDKVWFGAVRDEERKLEGWQVFAKKNSMWQTKWQEYDHLSFVALPFVAKGGLGELMKELGVRGVDEVPQWVLREARVSAKLIANHLEFGNYRLAQRVLDSFKMAVIAGRKQTGGGDIGFSVARMAYDSRYLAMVNHVFYAGGGLEVLEAEGLCGGDAITSLARERVQSIQEKYDNNLMSQIMGVDENSAERTNSTSTGKYKEYYDYYRDICRGPCKMEKPYVAHPKKSRPEIKCAGWCSDCEK